MLECLNASANASLMRVWCMDIMPYHTRYTQHTTHHAAFTIHTPIELLAIPSSASESVDPAGDQVFPALFLHHTGATSSKRLQGNVA
ncbi:hypothetical protein EON63_00575 [archaeon]|nr:MAG: hypothetical protein EON63_00575 [archaeon]